MADKIKHSRIGARPPRRCKDEQRTLRASWKVIRKMGEGKNTKKHFLGLTVGPLTIIARCPQCKTPLVRLKTQHILMHDASVPMETGKCVSCEHTWLSTKAGLGHILRERHTHGRRPPRWREEEEQDWRSVARSIVHEKNCLNTHAACTIGDLAVLLDEYHWHTSVFGTGENELGAYLSLVQCLKDEGLLPLSGQPSKTRLSENVKGRFHRFKEALSTLTVH